MLRCVCAHAHVLHQLTNLEKSQSVLAEEGTDSKDPVDTKKPSQTPKPLVPTPRPLTLQTNWRLLIRPNTMSAGAALCSLQERDKEWLASVQLLTQIK